MPICLSDMQLNKTATITAIKGGDAACRQKLFACGLMPGAGITVRRVAPFGDPIQIELESDIILSIRKSEGCCIYVEPA